jgi:hypothetical protein
VEHDHDKRQLSYFTDNSSVVCVFLKFRANRIRDMLRKNLGKLVTLVLNLLLLKRASYAAPTRISTTNSKGHNPRRIPFEIRRGDEKGTLISEKR